MCILCRANLGSKKVAAIGPQDFKMVNRLRTSREIPSCQKCCFEQLHAHFGQVPHYCLFELPLHTSNLEHTRNPPDQRNLMSTNHPPNGHRLRLLQQLQKAVQKPPIPQEPNMILGPNQNRPSMNPRLQETGIPQTHIPPTLRPPITQDFKMNSQPPHQIRILLLNLRLPLPSTLHSTKTSKDRCLT